MGNEEFWKHYEKEVGSYKELLEVMDHIFSKWGTKTIAWRGQSDASWPLYSSLYRRLYWKKGTTSTEKELYKVEGEVLTEMHRWGLHISSTIGRMSVLNQLAVLQHYGAPTRLIDVTFNPWIGVWFAVEPKYDKGILIEDTKDARLFAVDVTGRLINENDDLRCWEDALTRPWGHKSTGLQGDADGENLDNEALQNTWSHKVLAWKPSHFDGRIAAQNGAFIFGGVPDVAGGNIWYKGESGAKEKWKISEVREATSLALRPHKYKSKAGGVSVSGNSLYTFRIKAEAKKEIRDRLEKQYGYSHKNIYPDYTGFADFGTPSLPKSS